MVNVVGASVASVAIVIASAIAVETLAIVVVILAIVLVIVVEILVSVSVIFPGMESGIVAETSVSVSGTLLVTLVDQCGGLCHQQFTARSMEQHKQTPTRQTFVDKYRFTNRTANIFIL